MKIKKINKIDYSGDVYNLRIKSKDGLNHNYIANNINVSNCHKSRGNSISQIIKSCKNWEYKLGLSGTLKLDVEYSDFFKMQDRIGPLVMTLPAKFLIDNEYSPKIKIKQIFLEYEEGINNTVDEYLRIQRDKEVREHIKNQFRNPKDFGSNMLDIEKGIIFNSKERFEFLNRFIKKLGKNTLILFTDVKNEYGKTIVDNLKTWNNNTFYIDGSVDSDDRAFFKDMMEKTEDFTHLKFGDTKIKIDQNTKIPLTNGTYKLAKDINLDDDIENSWIDANK